VASFLFYEEVDDIGDVLVFFCVYHLADRHSNVQPKQAMQIRWTPLILWEKLKSLQAEIDQWESLTLSTDYQW